MKNIFLNPIMIPEEIEQSEVYGPPVVPEYGVPQPGIGGSPIIPISVLVVAIAVGIIVLIKRKTKKAKKESNTEENAKAEEKLKDFSSTQILYGPPPMNKK